MVLFLIGRNCTLVKHDLDPVLRTISLYKAPKQSATFVIWFRTGEISFHEFTRKSRILLAEFLNNVRDFPQSEENFRFGRQRNWYIEW